MEIDVRITVDENPEDAEHITVLEDEVLDQVFESAPLRLRKVVILRNDGFGNIVPDIATELEDA